MSGLVDAGSVSVCLMWAKIAERITMRFGMGAFLRIQGKADIRIAVQASILGF